MTSVEVDSSVVSFSSTSQSMSPRLWQVAVEFSHSTVLEPLLSFCFDYVFSSSFSFYPLHSRSQHFVSPVPVVVSPFLAVSL